MKQRVKNFLLIGGSFALPIAISTVATVIRYPHIIANWLPFGLPDLSSSAAVSCQTIIADPKPPLNVRSSPVVASDNMIGRLPNGTTLSIVDENEGWLRINAPLQGWVYKELTVTSCVNLSNVTTPTITSSTGKPPMDEGTQLFAIATEQYQSGNLNNAIALAKTVPSNSPAYPAAQTAIVQWADQWNRAEETYYSAQKAFREGREQEVIAKVNGYPEIRYWKEKMAPLVHKVAIQPAQ